MSAFVPVTDTDLARARTDPAFRQKLLEQSLETLPASSQNLRQPTSAKDNAAAAQMREAAELAVRLADPIQAPARTRRACAGGLKRRYPLAFPCRLRICALSARPRPGAEWTAAPAAR